MVHEMASFEAPEVRVADVARDGGVAITLGRPRGVENGPRFEHVMEDPILADVGLDPLVG